MSHLASSWAWDSTAGLKANAKLVLLAMADYADDRNQCWPAYETLADKCDISRTSVYDAIKALCDLKLIAITKRYDEGKRASNLYTLAVGTKAKNLSSNGCTQHVDLSSKLSSDLSSNLSSDGCTVTVNRTVRRTINNKECVQNSDNTDFPSELDTPEFKEQWKEYEAYRNENKFKRLKPVSVKTKLAEMADWGHEAAVAAIRDTIGNGWQGIFPPKSSSSKPSAAGAPKKEESSAQKMSTWEIKQRVDAINERMKELLRSRAEVAGGDYIWTPVEHKTEYFDLLAKRKKLNAQLIDV